jgi:hypothetical protein
MFRILYPSNPFKKTEPDEDYADEYLCAKENGINCSLFSIEDFDVGRFGARPELEPGTRVLYRGWMLAPTSYATLVDSIAARGSSAITSPTDYARCHYLPNWYEKCKPFTPATVFAKRSDNFSSIVADLDWQKYFVKDYVKSLTTSRGSVANTPSEISEVVAAIEKYRGQVEGGVCIREFENLMLETEERYFVVDGKAYSRDDDVPDLVLEVASRAFSPFFSVDVAKRTDGELRLIELGDVQVSDRKKWELNAFVQVLRRFERM